MQTAVVVGNGESRLSVDLKKLSTQFTIIGCNGIHRDISVPYLVCCDKRMVKEALLNPLNGNTKIYTRPEWYLEFPQTLPLPQLPYTGTKRADKLWHWGSGAAAILVACSLGASNIKLIGFDLYSFTNTVNNVYKGSPNYSGELSPPVDYSYWEYQIFKLFECYKHIKFEIYNTDSWKIPAQWNLPNVKLLDIENCDIDLHIK